MKIKQQKSIKITDDDVGKRCLVQFNDIGKVECLIVEHIDTKECRVYLFCSRMLISIENTQIVELYRYIKLN